MSIRKFGTEPAKVETMDQDNDPETLKSLGDVYDPKDENPHHNKPERDQDSES